MFKKRVAGIAALIALFAVPFITSADSNYSITNLRGGNNSVISTPQAPYYAYDPSIILDNGVYKMYWCASSIGAVSNNGHVGDNIMYAESNSLAGPWHAHDSNTANTYNDVFWSPGGGSTFDSIHVCDPTVIKVNGTYYLYYTGAPNSGSYGAIGVASSQDGINWTRMNNGNPIVNNDSSFLTTSPAQSASGTQNVTNLDSSNPMTWLVKSVCVDASNKVLAVDPYGGCPAGATIRKMQPTDPVPYHNLDQAGVHQQDAVPIPDTTGHILSLNMFDWVPFNQYNLYQGSDGYDIYNASNGWVDVDATQDGGGYQQTFFNSSCQVGNGSTDFFPTSGFLSGGSVHDTYVDVPWEQSGQSFPGNCPSLSSFDTTETSAWNLVKGFAFGGRDGNPTKTMDTFVASVGSKAHVEIFYFTREYGATRWEAWNADSSGAVAGGDCDGPTSMTYQGVAFTRVDCRDHSTVTPSTSTQIPVWPIPDINLLQHAHFDDQGGYTGDAAVGTQTGLWHRGGTSVEGNVINLSLYNSKTPSDVRYNSAGVRFLATNCAGTCPTQDVQEIYQEIPISQFTSGANYAYGANVRTEGGQGTIQITLQEMDSSGHVLWQDDFQSSVNSDNGPDQDPNQPYSAYLSSKFVSKNVQIPIKSGASVIRYYFTPLTTNVTFDIDEAWFAPWPLDTQGFGTISQTVPQNRAVPTNTYGAGDQSVTYANGWYYMTYLDTFGADSNPISGDGLYVIRAKDPLFTQDKQVLSGTPSNSTYNAPSGFVPWTSSNATSYILPYVIDGGYNPWQTNADIQYVPAWNDFLTVTHSDGNEEHVTLFDSNFNQITDQIIPNTAWSDGPALVSTADSRQAIMSGTNDVLVDTMRATTGGGPSSNPPNNIGWRGADLINGNITTGSIPAMTISADNTSITLGQSTTLHASFTPGSGDSLLETDINEVPVSGDEFNASYSGSAWGTAVQSSLTYTFTPSALGTYVFKPYVYSKLFPSWNTSAANQVTITVTAPKANPSMSLSADQTSLMLGQSTTIHANFAAGSGDSLLETDINEVPVSGDEFNASYSGSFWNSSLQTSLAYTFEPTQPGTYVFKPYAYTSLSNSWIPAPSSQWVTVTVAQPTIAAAGLSISADQTSIDVGQSVDIHATATLGSGDTLSNLTINEVPSSSGNEINAFSGGASVPQNTQNPLTYTFTPTAPGTYKFTPYVSTASHPFWSTLPSSQWVKVTVSKPKSSAPTMSISADNTSITVGQSTTIHANFTAVSGDAVTNNEITQTNSDASHSVVAYSGSSWSTSVTNPLTYTFTPTAPGTYTFKPYAQTNQSPSWTTSAGSEWVTVTVAVASTPSTPSAVSNPSATCASNTSSYSWGSVSGATSYAFTQKDNTTGYVWNYKLTSPSESMTGLYGSTYTWSVAACNASGCSTPVSGNTFSCASVSQTPTAPTMSISADQTSLTVGQSTTIHASFTAASGDAVTSNEITQTNDAGAHSVVAYSGASWSTSVSNPLTYTFTPSAAGTYVFKPYVETTKYPSWATPNSSGWVTVTVTAAQPPAVPTMSISADQTSVSIGQSTTIHANFAPGSGDAVTNDEITQTDAAGNHSVVAYSGASWSTSVSNPLTYTFTPSAAGTYVFKPYVETSQYSSWATPNSSGWVTVTVAAPVSIPTLTTIPLYQLTYQGTWTSHLFTSNQNEESTLISSDGFQLAGTTAWVLSNVNPPSGSVKLYRLYNAKNGSHLLSTWPAEVQTRENNGYVEETGIENAYVYPSTAAQPAGTVPLYRLHSTGHVDYYYTTSTSELSQLTNSGWVSEGIIAYVYASDHTGQTSDSSDNLSNLASVIVALQSILKSLGLGK